MAMAKAEGEEEGIRMEEEVRRAVGEVERVLLSEGVGKALMEAEAEVVAAAVERGGALFVHGVGREGLVMKGLGMRLMHLGLRAHCVGDMTAPPIGPADLLLLSAGPGNFATVAALAALAHAAGARVAVFTAQPLAAAAHFPFSSAAHHRLLHLPAPTMADNPSSSSTHHHDSSTLLLPMGSAYEAALFLLFELLVLRLRRRLAVPEADMRARHTNLE